MQSFRTILGNLPRFPAGETLNVSEVAAFMNMDTPISIRDLLADIEALPATVPYRSQIITDEALGGSAEVVFHRDGHFEFNGQMHASGFKSFAYTTSASVTSADGTIVAALAHTGKVYGSDTPGDDTDTWHERSANETESKYIRNLWPRLGSGKIETRCQPSTIGTLGVVEHLAVDLAEFVLAAGAAGSSVAACFVLGSELQNAGARTPGLGGVVGLTIVAGTVLVAGPMYAVPAVVAGIAAGAVVDSMVNVRPLSQDPYSVWGDEVAFARQVFEGSLDFSNIRLTNLSGIDGRAFTCPAGRDMILVNIGDAFDAPTKSSQKAYPGAGQLLIHELAHAWQIQHAGPSDGFVPGLICSAVWTQLTKGPSTYTPGPPGQPWHSFNTEAQASIVDRWFAGGKQFSPMNRTNPYFQYIKNNIWPGVT